MIKEKAPTGMVSVETAKSIESKPIHCPVCGKVISGTQQGQPCGHVLAMFDDVGEYVVPRFRESWRSWEGSDESWALERFPDPRFLKIKLTCGAADGGSPDASLFVVFDWSAKALSSSKNESNGSARVGSYTSTMHF